MSRRPPPPHLPPPLLKCADELTRSRQIRTCYLKSGGPPRAHKPARPLGGFMLLHNALKEVLRARRKRGCRALHEYLSGWARCLVFIPARDRPHPPPPISNPKCGQLVFMGSAGNFLYVLNVVGYLSESFCNSNNVLSNVCFHILFLIPVRLFTQNFSINPQICLLFGICDLEEFPLWKKYSKVARTVLQKREWRRKKPPRL